jgi:phosphoribosylamine--glycine ligase/phosphoribosylglycinamide formyltransferase/phosphoribosylformylglycinamidine cyclo-ligase
MSQGLVKAFAHITGGGLADNIIRVLPDGIAAEIDVTSWPMPPVFPWLHAQGGIAPSEMSKTFNCGLGGALIVTEENASKVIQMCADAGETVCRIGHITAADPTSTAHRVTVNGLDRAFAGGAKAMPSGSHAAVAKPRKMRTAVLISGSGTNLQSLINAAAKPGYPAEIVAVISNVPGVRGLERAKDAGIGSFVVDHKQYASREAFEEQVCSTPFDTLPSHAFLRLLFLARNVHSRCGVDQIPTSSHKYGLPTKCNAGQRHSG